MRRLAAAALLAIVAGCGGPQPGRTGVTFVDACLHWTACITPPASSAPCAYGDCLAECTSAFGPPPHPDRLPWPGGGIAVTPAQLDCMAAAGLDCKRALDCVSAPSPVACPSPTWTCDGDTLTRCDWFRGARVVTEDCAAEGLRCVPVGNEARCALAACDPQTFTVACTDNRIEECSLVYGGGGGAPIGGVVVSEEDCGAADATCTVVGNSTECVGNGRACTFVPAYGGIACDGDVLVVCDTSGHEERADCTALGMHCVMMPPNSGGLTFECGGLPGDVICANRPTFGQCQGTKLEYCDDKGNAELDCKSLGYRDCADGHCVL